VIIVVGYNYRWVPLVLEAKRLIDDGMLGAITNYRGRFFSVYGVDLLGLLTWRYLVDQGGYGASTDIFSHAVDLATFLLGPVTSLVGTTETFIRERPIPVSSWQPLRRNDPGDPQGHRDPARTTGMLARFTVGARDVGEPLAIGPEARWPSRLRHRGALSWNLERERCSSVRGDGRHAGCAPCCGRPLQALYPVRPATSLEVVIED
jgi:predicted dehydrogenase